MSPTLQIGRFACHRQAKMSPASFFLRPINNLSFRRQGCHQHHCHQLSFKKSISNQIPAFIAKARSNVTAALLSRLCCPFVVIEYPIWSIWDIRWLSGDPCRFMSTSRRILDIEHCRPLYRLQKYLEDLDGLILKSEWRISKDRKEFSWALFKINMKLTMNFN